MPQPPLTRADVFEYIHNMFILHADATLAFNDRNWPRLQEMQTLSDAKVSQFVSDLFERGVQK